MKWFEVAALVAVIDAVAMYCCCKVAKKSKDSLTLTDLDGIKFEISKDLIVSILNKGQYREVTTYMGEVFLVKETLPEIVSEGEWL